MHGLLKTIAIGAMALAAVPALAQTATKRAQHNAWGTYTYPSQGGAVCYVLSVPTDKQPTGLDHGDIYFFVSRKAGGGLEPQFIAGYNLQQDSKVTVSVGDKSFTMFTRGKSAWVENPADEPALVAAMKAGSDMKVAAKSGRGNATGYSFSLKGISAALDSIKVCN